MRRSQLTGSVLTAVLAISCVSNWGAAQVPERLDLETAIRLASEQNQQLKAARVQQRAAQSLIIQSELRPNPTLILQTENWRFHGDPGFDVSQDLDVFAYMAQPLETGGKRERRKALASSQQRLTELELRQLEWQIRQQVKEDFLISLLAQKELAILEISGEAYQKIVDYHRLRVQEGAMAEADLLRVQMEQERFGLNTSQAELAARQSKIGLLRTMGINTTDDFTLLEPGGFDLGVRGGASRDELVEQAQANRWEVLRARERLEMKRSELGLQRSLAKPDWSLIFGYKRTSGFHTLLGGLSLPLPLFDDNRGNVEFASQDIFRVEAELQARLREIRTEVLSALDTLSQRRRMLQQLEGGMIDRAEESLRIALAAYQEGATDLLRLLDAQRSRNEISLLHTRTKLQYQIDFIHLESAVGVENPRISEELFRD